MKKNTELLTTVVDELNELGMLQMSTALAECFRSTDFRSKDPLTIISEIIAPEYQARISKKYRGRLSRAHLNGCPQDISNCVDSKERKYMPNGITSGLKSLSFIDDGLNVCILGPSDSGKSYLAKAIGIQACRDYRVCYFHCEQFLEEMSSLKKQDYIKFQKKIKYYTKIDLLILDDFLLHTISDENEVKVLFEIMEKRSELQQSTIVCSQREPKSWKSMMLNDEVSSNSIMKRATKHFTVVIEMKK